MYLQAKTFRYSHKITQKLIAVIVGYRTPLVYHVTSIGLLSKKKQKQFVLCYHEFSEAYGHITQCNTVLHQGKT